MKIYFAPMEGLTGYIYRNAHHTYFNNIDKYFTPFISTNESGSFRKREMEDLVPENNMGYVVPQLLSNNSKDFILMANKIKAMGYNEINLNLGCPSGTVVAKNKGSGFLKNIKELDTFLYDIYSWGGTRISVKTRIGKDNPEEFYELIGIFNKYPISELIIHPRIQKDFYKNKPNMDVFKYALNNSKNPVCYNGDIIGLKKYNEFNAEFNDIETIMIGRGLLVFPGFPREVFSRVKTEKKVIKEFHDKLYSDYKKVLSGDKDILFKMKELWYYMAWSFQECEKHAKKIKKSVSLYDYDEAVSSLFKDRELVDIFNYKFL